jgi:hypothetical protein
MSQYTHLPPDQHMTLIILVTVIVLVLLSSLSSCTSQNTEDHFFTPKTQQITVYSFGKIIKIDMVFGKVDYNGYLHTISYHDKNNKWVTVSGEYILTQLK